MRTFLFKDTRTISQQDSVSITKTEASFLIIFNHPLDEPAAQFFFHYGLTPSLHFFMKSSECHCQQENQPTTLNLLTEYSFSLTALHLTSFQKTSLFLIPFPQSCLFSHTCYSIRIHLPPLPPPDHWFSTNV